jgi:hypothetical protein
MSIVRADNLNPELYSIDENPFGIPYGTWIARWWNWTAGIAPGDHPRDIEERPCNVNQKWDKVWFLPDVLDGKFVRNCEIPAGTAIFVPITTGEKSVAEDLTLIGKNAEMVKNDLITGALYCDNSNTERSAIIDGRTILGLEGDTPYRTNTSEIFNLYWNDPNIYNVKPIEDLRSYAEGWFLFLKPLSHGDHTIDLHSKISHTDESCNYDGTTKWNIKVN